MNTYLKIITRKKLYQTKVFGNPYQNTFDVNKGARIILRVTRACNEFRLFMLLGNSFCHLLFRRVGFCSFVNYSLADKNICFDNTEVTEWLRQV